MHRVLNPHGCPKNCGDGCKYAHNATEIAYHPVKILEAVTSYLASSKVCSPCKGGALAKKKGVKAPTLPKIMNLISLRLDADGFPLPMALEVDPNAKDDDEAPAGGGSHLRGAFYSKVRASPLCPCRAPVPTHGP